MTGSPIKRYSFTWPPRSLVWQGDELVDRIGAARWLEDGSPIMLGGRFPYTFDRALASPSGLYGALYAERQTKGLLVSDGSMAREIDRSYCHADDYAYPIALGRLCDGREVIAHCPKVYDRLEIDTLDKGKRLTRRRGKSQDPHWWAPGMEAPLAWPDIAVVAAPGAESRKGIVHDCPLLAVHPTAPRFAAVTAEAILVVDLGER